MRFQGLNYQLDFRGMLAFLGIIMASILMAAYAPMASYVHAQAELGSMVQDLQQKMTTEIQSRIDSYKKTLASMETKTHIGSDGFHYAKTSDQGETRVDVTKDGASAGVANSTGSGVQITVDSTGIHGIINISDEDKAKSKAMLQSVVDGLNDLKDKIKSTTSLDGLKNIASNLDAQFGVTQFTQFQAAVTQATDSMTAVFDNLKQVYNDLQSQLTGVKTCISEAVKDGQSVDIDSKGQSTTVTCGDTKVDNTNLVNSLQSSLTSLSTVIQSLGAVLSSAVALLPVLSQAFTKALGSLGLSGGSGDILGSLSSLLDAKQLQSLLNLGGLGDFSNLLGGSGGGMGDLSSLMTSFNYILSELNNASGVMGSAQSGLKSLSSSINL